MSAIDIVSEVIALYQNSDTAAVQQHLELLQLEVLTTDEALSLLIFLVAEAHRSLETNSGPMLRLLVAHWRTLIDDRGHGSIRVLLLAADIELDILHALLTSHPEWQSLDVVIDLSNAQLSEQINALVLARIEALLPGEPEEWQLLLQSLDSNERSTSVGKYVRRRAYQSPSYILIPTVLQSHKQCSLPAWKSILPDALEATEQLWSLAQRCGITLEDPEDYQRAKRQLEISYRISTEEEKYQQLQSLITITGIQDSIVIEQEIFRWLGPVNPAERSVEPSTTSNDPCDRFGCRMFSCDEYEDDISVCQYDGASWFTGMCRHCKRRINEIHHAVRLPLSGGGWVGCYCGWHCVNDGNPDELSDTYYLIGRYRTQLQSVGIWDRRR